MTPHAVKIDFYAQTPELKLALKDHANITAWLAALPDAEDILAKDEEWTCHGLARAVVNTGRLNLPWVVADGDYKLTTRSCNHTWLEYHPGPDHPLHLILDVYPVAQMAGGPLLLDFDFHSSVYRGGPITPAIRVPRYPPEMVQGFDKEAHKALEALRPIIDEQ